VQEQSNMVLIAVGIDCDLPGFQGVPGLDDFMSDDDDLEDEAA
jgi:hypothetical protein